MHVHADAVADAMSEVLEAGAVAAIDDDLARGGVDVGCRARLDARRSESCRLRAMDQIEDRLHLVSWLAQNEGAGDVGGVALDFAAVVEHEDGAFAQRLRLARAVRQRGELVDVEAGFAFESHAVVGGAR